jgi:glycosyltransferase involved in cell wall biosynthesis
MIRALVEEPMRGVQRFHVRMAYSREMAEVGKIRLRKAGHLMKVIAQVWIALLRYRPDIVYYPVAARLVPVLRDMVVLLAIRPFSRRVVLHFHAAGISSLWESTFRRNWMLAPFFRRAFFNADAAVIVSRQAPPDAELLQARHVFQVPNGIGDRAGRCPERRSGPEHELAVLFVGWVIEEKGVMELARACRSLWERGRTFRLDLVGDCPAAVGRRIRQDAGEFEERVQFHGFLTNRAKWELYTRADIFCFPTHHHSESFGVVCLEAMMTCLPVVATRWRGIPEVVEDGVTGLLVPVRDNVALAEALDRLIVDPGLREAMGSRGRDRFLERFTVERFIERMREVFLAIARDGGAGRVTTV